MTDQSFRILNCLFCFNASRFQIASLWLDNETLEPNGAVPGSQATNTAIVPTANNRVPRIGLCTNMTLIEAFKEQSTIIFGGADRLDRRVGAKFSQENDFFILNQN
jgi:hypothetical protein